jgi:hypothetical protein
LNDWQSRNACPGGAPAITAAQAYRTVEFFLERAAEKEWGLFKEVRSALPGEMRNKAAGLSLPCYAILKAGIN